MNDFRDHCRLEINLPFKPGFFFIGLGLRQPKINCLLAFYLNRYKTEILQQGNLNTYSVGEAEHRKRRNIFKYYIKSFMFCLQFERNIHQHLQTELKAEPAECMAGQNFAKMSELLLIITETKTQTGLVLRIWKMS